MAELNFPDVMGSFQRGYSFGAQQKQLRQQEQDNMQLRNLAPQVLSGNPDALAQAATIDPEAAGQYDKVASTIQNRAAGAAEFMLDAVKRGNPQEIEGRYQAVLPFLTRLGAQQGKTPPPQFDPAMIPAMEQLVAMRAQSGTQGRVQSTYIDAAGNRVAIMADGTTQVLGQNAPNTQIIDTGAGFYGVNKGNLQAAPVMVGGQPQAQQAAPQSGTRTVSDFRAVDESTGQPITDPSELAAIQNTVTAPGFQGGQQLTSAPKPSEAIQMAAFNARQSRTLSPSEAQAAGYRPGTIVQVDGFGNQRVVQAPDQDRQAMSEAQRKNILAAKAKVPQLQNAIRGLGRIDQALAKLNIPGVNTGPLDQYVVRNTEAGQELEAAVGGIQNSFLALTRVPGIGSQSDLEARIAALQYPSLDKAPEVNRRTMENLKLFARDLAKAYEAAVTQGAGESNPDADGAPEPGTEQDGYRFIGGDPADPSSWEPL